MIKIILTIIVLSLLAGGLYYYYQQKKEQYSLYDRRVLFSAYARSLDGLTVVLLIQDPEKIVEEKKVSNFAIPNDFFQKTVAAREELYVIGSRDFRTPASDLYQLYMVKTREEKFGYIPNYRLEEKNGTPFALPPRKGPVF